MSIARTWKQPKCPSTEEWIKKMWYIYTGLAKSSFGFFSKVVRKNLNELSGQPNTMEYYSAIKSRSIFCSNEVTLGGLLDSFRMGAGHPKDQAMT